MIIKQNIILLCVVLVTACGFQPENKVVEVRKYYVGGIQKDSIWYDTLYERPPLDRNSLSTFIHSIDSTLSDDKVEFDRHSSILKIYGKENFQGVNLTKYVVQFPIEQGYIYFDGIYASNIGTIYWRWLDGRKYLRLLAKKTPDDEYIYTDLLNHLDTTVLAVPPKSDSPEGYETEIQGEFLELEIPIRKETVR